MNTNEPIPKLLTQARELLQKGDIAQGEAMLQGILARQPHEAYALFYMGMSAMQYAPRETAIAWFRKAIMANSATAEFYCNMGLAYRELGEYALAMGTLRQALTLRPDYTEALANLALVLFDQGQYGDAEETVRRALELRPTMAQARGILGNILFSTGRHGEARAAYDAALALQPGYEKARINLLQLQIHVADEPAASAAEFRKFGEEKAAALGPHERQEAASVAEAGTERPLRIGYLSPDLRFHPLSFFLLPVFAAHDPARVQVHAFSDVAKPDALTQRFQAKAHAWHSMAGLTDAAVAERIQKEQIDILIDVAGLTQGARLGVLARKPAPVQVTWLGFPQGTGLTAVNYRLTDSVLDPAAEGGKNDVEELVRLPGPFFCYQPPEHAPEVTAAPSRLKQHITFGFFGHIAKLPETQLAAFARILQQAPEAELVFKAQATGDPMVRQRLRAFFAAHGAGARQLRFMGATPFENYLAAFGEVDVLLDSYPFNGHTNTCHGLWMGVPTLTRAGKSAASRMGATINSRLNMHDFMMHTEEGFITRALELASDPEMLARQRNTWRDRLSHSVLCDAMTFTRGLEEALVGMWKAKKGERIGVRG